MEQIIEKVQSPFEDVVQRAHEALAQNAEEREGITRCLKIAEAFKAAVPLDAANPMPEDDFLEAAYRFALTLNQRERIVFYEAFHIRLHELRDRGFLR